VEVFTPHVGVPLTDLQIAQRLESPVGQPPVRQLCRGKARPVVIVDDLNRPTPASRVVPALLRQFAEAGIAARDVSIVMAPGTHGAPRADALVKKVGAEAAGACQTYIHDCHRDVVKVGRTSFGTPVLVNKHVVDSDFLVGIGGLYPNDTAGFGGGTKLALGVLGFRSIASLHYGHPSIGWGAPNRHSTFRRDLDEIAPMIGLRTTVSLLLNADRDVVDVVCGDPHAYYAEVLRSARAAFHAPRPDEGADVIISNAYPNDLSLTFVRMKGIAPLTRAPRGASRIAIASCAEGLGFHGLFPFMNAPRFHRQRMRAVRASVLLSKPDRLAHKVRRRLAHPFGARRESTAAHPIWLYCPDPAHTAGLPAAIPGMHVTSSWDEILEAVRREQGGRAALRVLVYGCAALQWLA
jgi:nickel-dependent lactate racemase